VTLLDIATLVGILLGTGLIVWGIMQTGVLGNFVDFPSLAIVLGGALAATLISYPLKVVINSIKVVRNAFFEKEIQLNVLIEEIVAMANIARKEGLLALEESAEKSENEFLKKGIMLVVDGTDPELVRNVMETELNFVEERHGVGISVFETLAGFSPGFGMIGTLIGLINMMKDLSNPDSIGPNMSVALITTFYGSLFANFIFQPLANKLKYRSKQEILSKEMMIEGLLSTQAGENPRLIEEKLKTFVPPADRTESDGGDNKEGE
jgi:chemotaxis protein MotA